ncbi:MAG: hypothetical protein ACRDT6_00720 [Micromonosporaceae bacterium]
MTSAIPPYGQTTPVRIEFRRGHIRNLTIGLLVTGFFAAISVMAAVWPEQYLVSSPEDRDISRWMASGCGCLFGGLFLVMLISAPMLLRPQGLDFDQHGVWWWDRDERLLFAWSQLAAAGVGYMRSPVGTLRLKQGQALELYPGGEPFENRHPRLKMFRVAERPPRPGLPGQRYRIMLPSYDNASQQVEQAVRQFAPALWLGHYQRAWRRMPGR